MLAVPEQLHQVAIRSHCRHMQGYAKQATGRFHHDAQLQPLKPWIVHTLQPALGPFQLFVKTCEAVRDCMSLHWFTSGICGILRGSSEAPESRLCGMRAHPC
jgi:hypothetical protein